MEITRDMVEYVAELSRLKISEAEEESVRRGLGEIIGYMDILNNIDTEGVEAMSHAFAVKNVLRDDVVKQSADRSELLANAPVSDDEAFIVPKTVE
ncbi:MAG TPA: Asp-tRNA(Asn)/Glu-tRNA(Gln) amidotransferase subunit GatC [Candidatus Monoglobus merdigallinarum]|uniref:Aspartyl/glutamyl-tRNA(Asn/Gln) amidotransferase subunit C n=1 Tax=Candidatus Monoglobus merdigallinarum TaxID=2838698 RepID=A0A9D1PQQ5_9FIRM|nr:Asp-tRNA(Asn)/Glu-tRNA(Gln) amidotransferase subunit GatC [Candidatus Monoglobus merdigallinarum]